jgi:nitrate/nitrite-specific signal transduction histidine kinase
MLLCMFLAVPSPAFAGSGGEEMSMGEAINVAGRQRMLTQRIVKTYCLIGMKVDVKNSKKQLHDAVILFSKQLTMLERFTKLRMPAHTDVIEGLKYVRRLWTPLQLFFLKTPSKDMAGEVRDRAEILLAQSHLVVLMLEAASGSESGHLTNIAGRQRMLSQRIANLFLLRAWGIDNPRYDKEDEQARTDFIAALKEMQASKINTPVINDRLDMVSTQWRVFMLVSLFTQARGVHPVALELVATSSDEILKLMNEVTAIYASL